MRRRALWLATAALLAAAGCAHAETETDRLREAVRTLTGQLRTLEDQRAQTQAKIAQAEREKTLAVQAAAKLRSQLKEAQQELQSAVEEFNRRLEARDETLEKWKAAYAEAAGVAQEKDALRAKFEEEAGAFKARTRSCEAKNRQLLKVSGEILAAYRDQTPLDAALIKEPLIGFARVDHQNKVQDFQDRILDQDVKTTPQVADKADQAKGEAAKTGAGQNGGAPNAASSSGKGGRKNAGSKPAGAAAPADGAKPERKREEPEAKASPSGATRPSAPASAQGDSQKQQTN